MYVDSFRALAVASVLCLPGLARATIFDALGFVDPITQPSWRVGAGLSGSLSGGNSDSLLISGDVAAAVRPGDGVYALLGSYSYEEADGAAYAHASLVHARYRRYFSEHWALEHFLQHEFDEFKRIAHRALVGAGPRLANAWERMRMSLGVLPMYEYMQIASDAGAADAGRVEHTARLSNYVRLSVDIAEASEFYLSGYYQPNIVDFNDYRTTSSAGLIAPLTDWLNMDLSGGVDYDSTPAVGVESLDYRVQAGLQVSVDRGLVR